VPQGLQSDLEVSDYTQPTHGAPAVTRPITSSSANPVGSVIVIDFDGGAANAEWE
jgi:hypothetical protein